MELKYLVILIIGVLSLSSMRSNIIEVSDATFHDQVNSIPHNWLVIFHIPSCPHCKKALEVLKKVNDDINFNEGRIAEMNCDNNHATCMSFEIRHVPFIIKVVNGKFVKFNTYPNEQNLKDFIKEIPKEEDVLDLPPKMSYVQVFLGVIREAARLLSDWLNKQLKDNNISLVLTPEHSYYIMIGGLALLILFEVLLIVCCCSPKKIKVKESISTENKVEKDEKTNETIKETEKSQEEKEVKNEGEKISDTQTPIEKKNN